MRGQAFIIFKELSQATEAMHALQNFLFMGRELSIHFAKSTSNILGKRRTGPKPEEKEEVKIKKKEEPIQASVTNVLKVVELPKEITTELLERLFKQYPGYVRGTLIAEKSMAFIEFDSDEEATVALQGLKGFQLMPGHILQVDYAPIS